MRLPLHIVEPRFRRLSEERQAVAPIFGVMLGMTGREVGVEMTTLAFGPYTRLVQAIRRPDGRGDFMVAGARRIRIVPSLWCAGVLRAPIEWLAKGATS